VGAALRKSFISNLAYTYWLFLSRDKLSQGRKTRQQRSPQPVHRGDKKSAKLFSPPPRPPNKHDSSEQTAKTFHQSPDRLLQGTGNPREVMQSGRQYIIWLRHHLMEEDGRLFPMVERGLDPATEQAVRRAMEELSQESSARVAEGQAYTARA
jgi:hypothetical protein